MGFEYRIEFAHNDKAAVHAVIASLAGAEPLSDNATVEFRGYASPGQMPDAMATAESYGLYFCDFGGDGTAFLGRIVARLLEQFEAVRVTALE